MSDTNSSPIFDQVASTDGNPADDNTNTTDAQPVADQSAVAPETPEETQDATPDPAPTTDPATPEADPQPTSAPAAPDDTPAPDTSDETTVSDDSPVVPNSTENAPAAVTKYVPKLENYQAVQISVDNVRDAASWSGGTAMKSNGNAGVRLRTKDGYQLLGFAGDYVIEDADGNFQIFDKALFESLFTAVAE